MRPTGSNARRLLPANSTQSPAWGTPTGAGMGVLRRTRHLKHGFAILDYADLLYPQCRKKFDRLKWDRLIANNINGLSKAAALNLEESPNAHPDAVAHWK